MVGVLRSSRTERIALYVCLPLLLLVSFSTWRLWKRAGDLGASLTSSQETERSLRGELDYRERLEIGLHGALRVALDERDAARGEAERSRDAADAARREAEREAEAARRLEDQRAAELRVMRDALGVIAETESTTTGMIVRLSEDSFLFDFDSSELRPENREILSRIAGVLLASYGYRVVVYGHTDDQGPTAYNQPLSTRRARAVRDYLVEAGVPEDIVDSRGMGEASPRVPAKTREARQRNRRVEISIVDTVIDYLRAVPGGPE